tara:strand:+ start:1026 stop:1226 length:201 start_codon:yes stop_codon:yes gene_type:complete
MTKEEGFLVSLVMEAIELRYWIDQVDEQGDEIDAVRHHVQKITQTVDEMLETNNRRHTDETHTETS